jgi:RNA polymerase sigma-70 factor (ECF subfamily)
MNHPASDKDVELLRAIGGGDRTALSRFYDQYAPLLFSLAFRILNDQQEAEDVLREVFVQIWDQARTWHPGQGRPLSWAVALTRNKAVDYLHAYQHRGKLLEQVAAEMVVRAPGSPTANDSLRSRQCAELISTAVAELPEDQRKAIEVTFFSGLTGAEISETLKAPSDTVTAQICSGLLTLRERLEGRI